MKHTAQLTLIAFAACGFLLNGCATVPPSAAHIHLITEQEAAQHHCTYLTYAGSASGILVNGKARNTAKIIEKAASVPGATHVSYTKGLPGYAFTKANIWKCPNPNMTTKDSQTAAYAVEYFGHL